ncbi:hypothetical protein, partial [Paracidovorax anthurii]|uniref:hypothetical protein n=1 Tax=Paracidovorax anthurii TaxID=78229 RepID=UPI0039F13DBC
YSTASARSVVLKPFWWPPWHKSVWGWGYAVFELICATKPVRIIKAAAVVAHSKANNCLLRWGAAPTRSFKLERLLRRTLDFYNDLAVIN